MVSMEKEIFPQLIPRGLFGLPFKGQWHDVGDPQRLLNASHAMDKSFKAGPGSRIAAGAHLDGSILGRDCAVGDGARLDACVVGDGVTIDVGVHLKDCVVGDGERVRASAMGARIWTRPTPAGYPEKQVGNALAR